MTFFARPFQARMNTSRRSTRLKSCGCWTNGAKVLSPSHLLSAFWRNFWTLHYKPRRWFQFSKAPCARGRRSKFFEDGLRPMSYQAGSVFFKRLKLTSLSCCEWRRLISKLRGSRRSPVPRRCYAPTFGTTSSAQEKAQVAKSASDIGRLSGRAVTQTNGAWSAGRRPRKPLVGPTDRYSLTLLLGRWAKRNRTESR